MPSGTKNPANSLTPSKETNGTEEFAGAKQKVY